MTKLFFRRANKTNESARLGSLTEIYAVGLIGQGAGQKTARSEAFPERMWDMNCTRRGILQ
jgi:hypothetical protein